MKLVSLKKNITNFISRFPDSKNSLLVASQYKQFRIVHSTQYGISIRAVDSKLNDAPVREEYYLTHEEVAQYFNTKEK